MIKPHSAIARICAIAAMSFTASCGGDERADLVIPSVPQMNRITIDTTSMNILTSAAFTMAEGTSVAFSWEVIAPSDSWNEGFLVLGVPKQIYGKKYTLGSGSETFDDMEPSISYKADDASAEIFASESDGGITGTIEYKAFSAAFSPLTSTTVSFSVKYDITLNGKRFQGQYKGAAQRITSSPKQDAALLPFTTEFLAEGKNPTPATPTNSVTMGQKTVLQADLAPSFRNDGESMLGIDLGVCGSISLPAALQGHTIDLAKYYYPFTSLDHNWTIGIKTAEGEIAITGNEPIEERLLKSGYLYVSTAKEGKVNVAFDIMLSDDSKFTGDLTDVGTITE